MFDLDGDTVSNERVAGEGAFSNGAEMGSRCAFSGNGMYGLCPLAGVESVGAICSCPTVEGKMTGSVVK